MAPPCWPDSRQRETTPRVYGCAHGVELFEAMSAATSVGSLIASDDVAKI
jgi:hypothetical protein